jgi:hypothetical protein
LELHSAVTSRRSAIESLISEIEEIEDAVSEWQRNEHAPASEVRFKQTLYVDWYTRAQVWLTEPVLTRFRDMYNRGSFTPRIKAFLSNPLELSVLYNSENPTPLLSKWQNQFEKAFKTSVDTQREILIGAMHTSAGVLQELEALADAFRRFPRYLAALHDSGNGALSTLSVENEKDLQGVVLAILRLMYDDVRPEDYISQHGGSRTRVDFFVADTGVMVETKMTRDSLRDKEVGNELLEDFGRYPSHPKCTGIFAFVYDPKKLLKNPVALQNDLTRVESDLVTRTLADTSVGIRNSRHPEGPVLNLDAQAIRELLAGIKDGECAGHATVTP